MIKLENSKLISFNVRVHNHKALVTAKYEAEYSDGIHIIAFDDIPLQLSDVPSFNIGITHTRIDFGFGEIDVPDRPKALFTDHLVKPKIREMTIEEIEHELGYYVKIVKGHKID